MRSSRVFVEEPLKPDAVAQVEGSAANHILRVLRLQVGDALVVFDGRGGEYEARIEGTRKDTVLVAVGAHRPVERESPLAVTLAQGVARGERMDVVVQKATELGVRAIVPLLTERTVVRLDAGRSDSKLRHWSAVAVAACEQCGRNTLPRLPAPQTLEAFLAASRSESAARVVLSPRGERRVSELQASSGEVILLVGPEGGLAEHELDAALAVGFQALRLGPRILRTETAAIAALAALQLALGDF